MVESNEPGDLICVDFYGPLPKSIGSMEYVFVVLDMFSKYVKLYPIKKKNCETILRKLFDLYIPEIQVIYSSIRHPKSNPIERVMRELGRLFRTLCSDKHTRWAKHIKDIEFFLNITTHYSTGFPPVELQFNKKSNDEIREIISFPEEYLSKESKIVLARKRLQRNFNKRARTQKSSSKIILKEKDLVLSFVPKQSDAFKRVTRKFFHLYYGEKPGNC